MKSPKDDHDSIGRSTKCIAAFCAHCEQDPTHVFVVLIGQPKGQILLEAVQAVKGD